VQDPMPLCRMLLLPAFQSLHNFWERRPQEASETCFVIGRGTMFRKYHSCIPEQICGRASSGTEKNTAASGTCCNSTLCLAGDHIRQSMLQVGSASEPVAYVEGILGKGHLQRVGCGYKPRIDSLLKELKIA
jgi:hypothetical protein